MLPGDGFAELSIIFFVKNTLVSSIQFWDKKVLIIDLNTNSILPDALITAYETKNFTFEALIELSEEEKEIIMAGGLLPFIKKTFKEA